MDLYSFFSFFWTRQSTDRAIPANRQTQEKKMASRARELIRTRSAVKRVLDSTIPIATHHYFVLGLVVRRNVFRVNLFCNSPS